MASTDYDYGLEGSEIQRRMLVAKALQEGGLAPMGPTEVVGGYAVKRSPFEALAKVGQAGLARLQMDQALKDQRALGDRYRGDLRSGLDRFYNTMEGSSTSIPGGEGSDAYGGEVKSPGDPRRAVIEAMASSHPGLQRIGESYMTQLNKDQLTMKDFLPLATPESVLANPSNRSAWKPKRDLKGVTAGEVLVDAGGNVATPGVPSGGQPSPGTATPPGANSGTPSGPGWSTVSIGGDLYQQTATGLKKLDNATKVTTTVNNRIPVTVSGQKAGMEKWAELAAKTVEELTSSARQSVKLETQLNQLDALTAAGTNAGPTAGIQTFVQGLAKTAGIPVDPKTLNNSQAFESVATQAWAALMQQNGGARGLVKEESEKLAASLPALIQTPQGRAQITAVLKQQARQNRADAEQAVKEYAAAIQSDDPSKFTFGLGSTQLPQSAPNPAAPGGVDGKPLSLDDYLKSKGVK